MDAVFCPSPEWKETFSFYGIPEDQLFYGVNLVDNTFWQKPVTGRIADFSVDYLLTAGRQIPKKNLIFPTAGLPGIYIAKVQFLQKIWFMVGEGPVHTELEMFVRNNNISTVHFLPFISQKELRDVI